MTFPIPAFLARFAQSAQAMWLGRLIGAEGWALHRRLDVSLFGPQRLRDLARLSWLARGHN